jgi:hypothetical protein
VRRLAKAHPSERQVPSFAGAGGGGFLCAAVSVIGTERD